MKKNIFLSISLLLFSTSFFGMLVKKENKSGTVDGGSLNMAVYYIHFPKGNSCITGNSNISLQSLCCCPTQMKKGKSDDTPVVLFIGKNGKSIGDVRQLKECGYREVHREFLALTEN